MSRITEIENAININKKHIDEFQLESEVGTKKMKEKFYRNAVVQRNNYIFIQQDKFDVYKKKIYREMKERFNKYFPTNNNEMYDNEKKYLNEMKEVIELSNPFSNSSYKLGLLSMISRIKEESDSFFDDINATLSEFINKFAEVGIVLSIEDFSYTMFTKKYMKDFFSNLVNSDINLEKSFETIYWECPDFLKHLKLNLWNIIDKYKNQLDEYALKIKEERLKTCNLNDLNVVSNYYERVNNLSVAISRDAYINLNNFLDKRRNISDYLETSGIRKNNFNLLVINNDFDSFDDDAKNKYYLEVLDLAKTLPVLKLYYRYEFIIKDLQEKFSKRVENKTLYDTKLKEIKKEEANRLKISNSYLRANGIGFLAKKDDKKISSCKLEMNEQISKLYNLYNELHELEIIYKMNNQLSEVSSLYDLFMAAYSSYFYLEKMFNNNFKDIENFSITKEFNKYFDFIYNSNNLFLTKINGFVPNDMAEIISDKYRLMELNVSKDVIAKDAIDSIIDTVNFVKLVKDINDGSLPLDVMNFIVTFNGFDEVDVTDAEI